MLNKFFTKEVKFPLSTENYLSLSKLIKAVLCDSSVNANIKPRLKFILDPVRFQVIKQLNKVVKNATLLKIYMFLLLKTINVTKISLLKNIHHFY